MRNSMKLNDAINNVLTWRSEMHIIDNAPKDDDEKEPEAEPAEPVEASAPEENEAKEEEQPAGDDEDAP